MKSNISSVFLASVLIIPVINIGCNPRVEREFRNEKSKRLELQQHNAELLDENQSLSTQIKNALVTDNFIWINTGEMLDYFEAEAYCQQFKYDLPDEKALEELEAYLHANKDSNKQEVSAELLKACLDKKDYQSSNQEQQATIMQQCMSESQEEPKDNIIKYYIKGHSDDENQLTVCNRLKEYDFK